MNEAFINACQRKAQKTPPVWMMRQAGRYHQHYQKLRKQYSFMDLCKDPKLAAETALGPIEDFDFDVSILFSDLLFPLEALGMGLKYDPAPTLGWHLNDSADFKKMTSLDLATEQLEFQGEAVRETRKQLPDHKSLIGFVGSPWTLFVYAIEGTHKGSLIETKKRLPLFSSFCELVMPLIVNQINIQLQAGAEKVMVFDTAAGELSALDFKNYLQPHLDRLIENYPEKLGYYSKHTVDEHLTALKADGRWGGFGYDHRWNLFEQFSSGTGFVQGNFDQSCLFLGANEFEKYLRTYLEKFQGLNEEERAGWVCGLGHGVLPKTPEDNVRNFVKIVRETFS